MRRTLLFILGAAVPAGVVRAQSAPVAREIFKSDTITAIRSAISPDQRWLLFQWYLSEQESRLMIRPLAGGEPRYLVAPNPLHQHLHPQFTPQGDRFVGVSSLPRRGTTDYAFYLVTAPFDTKTGTLTGPLRQVSLDGVRGGPNRFAPAISPDGRFIAYVRAGDNSIRIVPTQGGNPRTLTGPRGNPMPSGLVFSPDGQAVLYALQEGAGFIKMRVSVDGGVPTELAHYPAQRGILSPDNRYSVLIVRSPDRTKPSMLRLFAADGRVLGEFDVPQLNPFAAVFSADGKYLTTNTDNTVAAIKLVPLAGGPIRQITPGDFYDWPGGFRNGNSIVVETADSGRPAVGVFSLDGKLIRKFRAPEGTPGYDFVGVKDDHLIYRVGDPRSITTWRMMAMNLQDGSQRELLRDVLVNGGATPAGGMYYGIQGDEFYARRVVGKRVQLLAVNLKGESRLLGEFPSNIIGTSPLALYRNRVVYREPVKDSVRMQMLLDPGKPPRTLATFPQANPPGDMAWSFDGRRLAVSTGGKQMELLIYQFDPAGEPEGPPQRYTLPFEYWYESFWLPDGSGLTTIAQLPGKATTDLALIKLVDPSRPVILTQADPNSIWGHSLSPDGKYEVYPSEEFKGSSIYLIEMAELLKRVKP